VSNDTGPVAGSDGDGAFGVQMRGYSRRQVDAFAAQTRSQIQDLTERLSRSLGELERLRTELSAARQALSHKPAQEQVSDRVGQILQLAGEEATALRARAQDEIGQLRDQAQQEADRLRAEAREQAEPIVGAAQEQAENAIAAAQAEAGNLRSAAQADSAGAVGEAAKQADSTRAAATSQAKQILSEATARASAIHDGAGQRLSLLTSKHTQAMRQVTQIQDAVTGLVASVTAQGPPEDEPAGQGVTSPPAGSSSGAAPRAPAAARAAEGRQPPTAPVTATQPGKDPPPRKAAPS
jgi:cell division septum initiation protein DivIVA